MLDLNREDVNSQEIGNSESEFDFSSCSEYNSMESGISYIYLYNSKLSYRYTNITYYLYLLEIKYNMVI